MAVKNVFVMCTCGFDFFPCFLSVHTIQKFCLVSKFVTHTHTQNIIRTKFYTDWEKLSGIWRLEFKPYTHFAEVGVDFQFIHTKIMKYSFITPF